VNQPSLETSSSEEDLTTPGLLDVPLIKDDLILQHLVTASLSPAIATFSSILNNRKLLDNEPTSPEMSTLENILPYMAMNRVSHRYGPGNNGHKVSNTSSQTNQKNRNTKTRQQYQQEWVAKQGRNHSRRKTRQQYQREWEAKQRQLKKRAEWKRKKQLLKKKRIKKTVRQLEKGLLNENDW